MPLEKKGITDFCWWKIIFFICHAIIQSLITMLNPFESFYGLLGGSVHRKCCVATDIKALKRY